MGGLRYPGAAANSFAGGFMEGRDFRQRQERGEQEKEIRAGQIEDLKKSREYRSMLKEHRAALGELISTGGANTGPLINFYNTYNPGSNNAPVNAIEPTEDGGYDMRFSDGRSVKFKDMDDLGVKFTAIVKPDMYLSAMQKAKQEVGKQLELHEGKLKLNQRYGIPTGRRSAVAQDNDSKLALHEGKLKLNQEYRDSPGSRTAKPARYPNSRTVQDAEDMLLDDPELSQLPKGQRRAMAFKAASRAMQLLQGGDMDAADALTQAIDDERRNITPGEKRSLLGVDFLMPDKRPSYQEFRGQGQEQEIQRITGDEDFHRLPSGTRFLAPDGKVRIKP